MGFRWLILMSISWLACLACTVDPYLDSSNENLIGEKLGEISGLYLSSGEEAKEVVIFDGTTRRIHKFDLERMEHRNSTPVTDPEEEHFVLHTQEKEFSVDLTRKHLTLLDQNQNPTHEPIQFVGTPVSAAFRPELGYLVVYDDAMSVVILKIKPTAQVETSWVGGPILEGVTIVAGDINQTGQLILALSNNKIAIVNLQQTLVDQQWVHTSFATSLQDIKWLAPVPGRPDEILVKADKKIALINMNSQSVISELDSGGQDYTIEKYSKIYDPHILYRSGYWASDLTLAYVKDSKIETMMMPRREHPILHSVMNLSKDAWTMVAVESINISTHNNINEWRWRRMLTKYKLSTMLAEQKKTLPDEAQLQLASSYIFALYPSELGYAARLSVDNDEMRELKLFNLKYIQR